MVKSLIYCFLLALVLWSCSTETCDELDVSGIAVDLQVRRLDQQMFDLRTKQDIGVFLNENPLFGSAFLGLGYYPNDSILIDNIYRILKDPYMDSLYRETQRIFSDLTPIKKEFEDAFRHLRYFYPEAKIPVIKTVITGFGQDLFVSDSVIIIGLDFFLGDQGKYRPVEYPGYILRRYQPEYIVPTAMLNISKIYNKTDYQDKTVLADMIYYGKSYYFTKRMLPCVHDSLIIQYRAEELEDVKQNEDIIWANFIQNSLLYETSYFVKKKFLEERPSIPEIGDNCPGRGGTWVGWEIVLSYVRENPEVSLTQLMETKNAQAIFTQSKYKPRK